MHSDGTAEGLTDEEAETIRDKVEKELQAKHAQKVALNFQLRPEASGIHKLSEYADVWFYCRTAQREWEEFNQKE